MVDGRYTHGHHASVLRSHTWRTAENSAAYLLPHLRPGDALLDVGCGPATLTADLAGLVAPGTVVAIDNAPAALAAAAETLAARAITGVRLEQSDVFALPYSAGSFDVVHAHQVLQHLSEPVRALCEMRRVCKTGGIVAARDSDYPAMAWHPALPELERWMATYLAVARANGAEPAGGRHLLAWAQAAGFSEVIPSASVWCFATAPLRAWWGGLWAERVVASAFAAQAVEIGVATPAELATIAAGWRRWAAAEDGWFVVVNGEVLCRP
jgi:ubiquinone/menaquinone biosynthesis C-methylase UbiE